MISSKVAALEIFDCFDTVSPDDCCLDLGITCGAAVFDVDV